MTLSNRIFLLSRLGERISEELSNETSDFFAAIRNNNAWFTQDNVTLALNSVVENYLQLPLLTQFAEKYAAGIALNEQHPQTIGVVAAGNLPAVSIHDVICVFLSGHKLALKVSSTDAVLMRWILNECYLIDERSREFLTEVPTIAKADAYIATGSDNTARYFHYYFANKPHIIRQNRTSVAVLTGNETKIELCNLGNDIFQYFGLGCRNISKVFVPEGYSFNEFYEAIEYWSTIMIHHKYNNNYDYNKSIYLVNREEHLDNGFLLLKPDEGLVSPLSVLFYETYSSAEDLHEKLAAVASHLQCIVGEGYVPFGQAQKPLLTDFADGVDVMKFLNELSMSS